MNELINPAIDPSTLPDDERAIVNALIIPKTAGELHRELGMHYCIVGNAIKSLTRKGLIQFIVPPLPTA